MHSNEEARAGIRAKLSKYPFFAGVLKFLVPIVRWIRFLAAKEHISYGKLHQDKTFFVISFDNIHAGLFSNMLDRVLPYLEYADAHNYIPIVDITNSELPLLQDEGDKGVYNAWEHYFKQCSGYQLDEVYQCCHVIRMKRNVPMPDAGNWHTTGSGYDSRLYKWNQLIKKYIHLADEVDNRVKSFMKEAFPLDKKVMAVSIRTIYRWGALLNMPLFNNHSVVETYSFYIKAIEAKMKEWGYEYFFLAIDDKTYSEKIKGHFGKKCISLDRPLAKYFKDDGITPEEDMETRYAEFEGKTRVDKGYDYLTEVYLLGACDALYGDRAGGSMFAYFLNGGSYEYLEFYDGGTYEDLGKQG